jgi:hypothetical protein
MILATLIVLVQCVISQHCPVSRLSDSSNPVSSPVNFFFNVFEALQTELRLLDQGVGDGVTECDDALSGFDAMRKQDHKQALKHFHSAMLKDEDNPLALAGIGIALIALGKGGGIH